MKTFRNIARLAAPLALALGAISCGGDKGTEAPPPVVVDAPQNIRTSDHTNRILVSWDSNRNSTGYQVQVVGTEFDQTVQTTSVYIEMASLEYEKEYEVRVRTLIDENSSDWATQKFTTPVKPVVGNYLGTWTAGQDDVTVSAKLSLALFPGDIDLSSLIGEQYTTEEEVSMLFEKGSGDNKLLLSIVNISDLIPIAGISKLEVEVDQYEAFFANGPRTEEEPITFDFRTEQSPNGIPFASLPVPEQLANILDGVYIIGTEITVESTTVRGQFVNDTKTEAEIQVTVNTKFNIHTTGGGLEVEILKNALLNDPAVGIVATIKCRKEE